MFEQSQKLHTPQELIWRLVGFVTPLLRHPPALCQSLDILTVLRSLEYCSFVWGCCLERGVACYSGSRAEPCYIATLTIFSMLRAAVKKKKKNKVMRLLGIIWVLNSAAKAFLVFFLSVLTCSSCFLGGLSVFSQMIAMSRLQDSLVLIQWLVKSKIWIT